MSNQEIKKTNRSKFYFGRSILFLFMLLVFQYSCKKDAVDTASELQENSTQIVSGAATTRAPGSYYNNSVMEIAEALSLALADNADLRKLIKKEALKKFDGDYDVLMSTLQNVEIPTNKVPEGTLDFENLLRKYNKELDKGFLQTLINTYPDIQVSVPVNIDKWSSTYVPVVAIQPDYFDHGNDTHVPGFLKGKPQIVDAYNPSPTKPVVVVGRNERMVDGELVIGQDVWECNPPVVDITLTATTWTSSIHLSWVNGENTGGEIMGYVIYRKAQGETEFEAVGYTIGENNTTYTDFLLLPNNQYEYYVVARCPKKTGLSDPSNIANAVSPDRPNPPVEFEVFQTGLYEAEVRWNFPDGETILSSELYRKVDGVDADWIQIASLEANDFYYIDNDVPPGKKVNYKLSHSNLFGSSEPKYDFIMGSYRDISQASNIYLDGIYVNATDVEPAIWGEPEFLISVASANPQTSTSIPIQEAVLVEMCGGDGQGGLGQAWYSEFDGILITNWEYWHWKDMISFKMVEHDNFTFSGEASFGVKFKNKNADKTAFDLDGSVVGNLEYDGISEDCGTTYYNYYDPIEWHLLQFPNYDAQIRLRVEDLPNQCEDN